MDRITAELAGHYAKTFAQHGATAKGVDWGDEETARLRYDKMLAVIRKDMHGAEVSPSLLDVGCGFGGLARYGQEHGLSLRYVGIDVAGSMIEHGRSQLPDVSFVAGDFLDYPFDRRFDYVVCNGILTQKLSASTREMEVYARKLIRRMFDACDIGIAFNVMTNQVNFMAQNLFYKSPVEMISFCLSDLSSKFKIDHAYPLYEYTTYVYHE